MTAHHDIAVIGAGLAGLTAGALATRAGLNAVVLDAHPAGGRARTNAVGDFRFNQGAHAVYLAGEGHRILTHLGIRPTGGPPAVGQGRLLIGGSLEIIPASAGGLARTGALSAKSKLQVGKLMAGLAKIDAASFASMTVHEWFESIGLRPDARAVIGALLRVASYSNAPDLLSAALAIQQLQASAAAGVLYLDGGWQQLVDALAARTQVRTGAAVHGVRRAGDRFALEGTDVTADAVVVAAGGPAEAVRLTGIDPDPDRRMGPPIEAACLDLGLRRPPHIPVVFAVDDPLYLSTHCPPARLAPEGHAVVQLMKYLAPHEHHDALATRAQLQALAEIAGIERSDIVESRYLHRMTVTHALPVASSRGLAGRPLVECRDEPGLFLAGDWVGGRGHLADAAYASAEEAVTRAMAFLSDCAGTRVGAP